MDEISIYLVRHGETEWNRLGRLQSNQDSPLTALGVQQAKELRSLLAEIRFVKAFVSPLKRAVDTLGIILQDRCVETEILADLREIELGPWEGVTKEEARRDNPDQHEHFWRSPDKFCMEGAETFQMLQDRTVRSIESIFSNVGSGNYLLVSHWIAIKVIMAYYLSIPIENLPDLEDPDNGSILRLTKKQGRINVDIDSASWKQGSGR